MQINTPNGTMTLTDARPSLADQTDILAAVTDSEDEYEAAWDAANGFRKFSALEFHEDAAAFVANLRREGGR